MAIKTFTSGETLTASDTNTYLNNGGLVYITKTTFSSSVAVNVDNCFTSNFTNYVIALNMTGASANTGIYMRLRSGGTTDASSIYLLSGFISYMGGVNLTAATSGGATTDWFLGSHDTVYYPNMPFRIEVMNPQVAYRTAIFATGWQPVNPMPYYRNIGGVTSNTSQYDGFSIIGNSASFTISGSVSVYGYRQP